MRGQRLEHIWQRAASFAARSHAGQKRKDRATPYVAHPFRVALTVRHLFGIDDDVAIAAALLHDVIEDTTADYDDLLEEFGEATARAVAELTKDMRLPEEEREAAYDRQLAGASFPARAVKLADVYDNLCDVLSAGARSDREKAEKREKALEKARRAIACAGDDPGLARAIEFVRERIEAVKTEGPEGGGR